MSVFIIDTDYVNSSSSNISSLSSKISSLCDSVNSYDVNSDEFDFSSAKSVISNNLEACSIKIKNTSKIFEAVTFSHESLQNSLKFGEDEEESSISYRQNSSDGASSGYYSGSGYSSSSGSDSSSSAQSDDVSSDESISDVDSSSSLDYLQGKNFTATVQFNLNGGEGNYDTFNLKDGETANLPTPTRDGYEFLGWSTSLTGPGLVFGSVMSTSLLTNSDTTLYAMWKKSGEADSTEQGFQYSSTDKKWYYYDENGNKVTGEVEVNGKYYYLDENTGEVTYGWRTTSDGKKVFYNEYGERVSGGNYLPSQDGSVSDTRTWYYSNGETGETSRALDLGGWDFEDWDYVSEMREKAVANGSDTDWYVVIDCDYPCRDTIFQKVDGDWVPVAGYNSVQGYYTVDGGSRTIPGLHKVTHKYYESSSGPGRITSFVDYWDDGIVDAAHDNGQSIHAGNDASDSGYGTHGCSSLSDSEAQWIYDNVPVGSTVEVCGNATGIPDASEDYRVESSIGHDYQLGNNPIGCL